MAFDYEIKADPAKALQASKDVEASLVKVEKGAVAAGFKMTSIFAQGSVAARNAAGQFAATSVSVGGLGEKVRAAAAGASTLNTQLRAEYEMLERLRGPLRQAERDLQTLETLYRRGALTAGEYASEMERIRRASGGLVGTAAANPVNAIALGATGPSAGAGKLDKIASGIGSLNLKQAAQGAAQAFELLNAQLHLTDTTLGNAVGSAVKFGAAGMQMAGPWGAAIGALVGITASLGDELYDWIDGGAHARRMKALQEEAEANRQLAESYHEITESVKKQYEEDAKRDTEAADKRNGAITTAGSTLSDAQGAANEKLRELKVALYSESRFGVADAQTLTAEQQKLLAATKEKNGVSQQEILLTRQVRDATTEQTFAAKAYGKTIADLRIAEAHRLDAQVDLKKALDDGVISLKEYNRELAKTGGDGFDVAIAKATLSLSEPIDNAKRDLKALDEAWKTAVDHSSGSMAIYKAQRKSLLETISGHQIHDYYTEMLTQIRQPEQDWRGRLAAINALLRDGRISVEQYGTALRALAASYPRSAEIERGWIAAAERFKEYNAQLAQSNATGVRFSALYTPLDQFRPDNEFDRQASTDAATLGAGQDSFDKQAAAQEQAYLQQLENADKLKEKQKELVANTAKWNEELNKIPDTQKIAINELTNAASSFAENIVNAARGADVAWGSWAVNLASHFAEAIAQATLLRAITGSTSGAIGAGVGGGYGGLLGLIFGGAHATGGSFTAQGSGGTDSVPVLFRMSPGESAHFVPQGKSLPAAAMGGSSSGAPAAMPPISIHNHWDRRELLSSLDTRDGARRLDNWARKSGRFHRS